jgi:hypothetical protein
MRNGRSTRIDSRKGHAVPRQTSRRVCEAFACATVLSIYNAGSHCYAHEPPGPYARNDVLRYQ